MTSSQLCLVTGATGYVGGRLVPELLAAGHRVRVMVRDKSRISGRDWSGDVEVAVADATDADAVRTALEGIDVAYYLLHSIGQGKDFADDRGADRPDVRRRGRGRRSQPDGLPRWVGAARRGAEHPHGVARARRRGAAGVRSADRGAAGGRRDRVGLGELRDVAAPDRAAAGDDHPEVGREPAAADRDPRRPALPGRLRHPAGRRQPGLRRRRPGRVDVQGDDAALRRREGAAAAADGAGTGADPAAVQPLGRAGHAGARAVWPSRWSSRSSTRRWRASTTSRRTCPTRRRD